MSENAAHALERLELESATGCLLVDGPEGAKARLYVIEGQLFHAEGPAGEGDAALSEALSWWEATTSFDPKAKLPNKETIGVSPVPVELPEVWPDEVPTEKEKRFGFENEVTPAQALLVLMALIAAVVIAVLILSRKY